jgi:predicted DNA-binding transcriptional regulator AlpA
VHKLGQELEADSDASVVTVPQACVPAPQPEDAASGGEITALWDERETARLIHVSAAALRKWRREGTGPTYIRAGRLIRYRKADVETWLAAHAVESK